MVIYWGRVSVAHWISPNVLEDCHIFFITFHSVTFESVGDATVLGYRNFVFGCHQVFDGFAPLKVYLYTMLSTDSFYAFIQAFCVCYHCVASCQWGWNCCLLVFLVLLLISFGWFGALILFLILFKVHARYLHLVRAFWRCSMAIASTINVKVICN